MLLGLGRHGTPNCDVKRPCGQYYPLRAEFHQNFQECNSHWLQNQYSQMKKIAFNQNASDLGRWWTEHPPPKHLQGFCLAIKAFKGRQGSNLDNR